MLILATGAVTAKHENEGGRIIISVSSGCDTIEIAMDFHTAMQFARGARQAIGDAIESVNREAAPTAQIINFPSARVRRA